MKKIIFILLLFSVCFTQAQTVKRWRFGGAIGSDSTNGSYDYYNFFNKVRICNDLYALTKIYLDTTGTASLYFSGYDLNMDNTKQGGIILNSNQTNGYVTLNAMGTNGNINLVLGKGATTNFNINKNGGAFLTPLFHIDSLGTYLDQTNMQYYYTSDTASDYLSHDSVTINTQSGTATTKSLTITAGNTYSFKVHNALTGLKTKIIPAMVSTTSITGIPIILYTIPSAANYFTVTILDVAAVGSVSGSVTFSFLIINKQP